MTTLHNFINGNLSERSAEHLIQFCPHTGKEIRNFVNSDFLDVVASVQAANKAQKKWQELPRQERILVLRHFAYLISENIELFSKMESEDLGIPLEAARKICQRALLNCHQCLNLNLGLGFQSQNLNMQFQLNSPVGIVGIMTDWQRPFAVILENLAASLACGNLIILYPCEFSIRSTLKLAELAIQAQIPAGVFNVLIGRGEDLAIHIAEHPGIKYLRFYGENTLGEKIHKLAAENQKRIFLSLGANNVAILFADSQLETSVQKILALGLEFHLYGRNRINRILVQEKFLAEFKVEFKSQIEALVDQDMLSAKIGPLPNKLLKNRFETYIEQSKKDRAKVYFSQTITSASESCHVPLTIYEDLTNCSTLHQQDLVGPILFLQSFKYFTDLPKILNSGAYAGSAYVWTKDLSRIHKIAQQLEVSKIIFNSDSFGAEIFSSISLKQSGLGQNGLEGLMEFNLNRKLIQIGDFNNEGVGIC